MKKNTRPFWSGVFFVRFECRKKVFSDAEQKEKLHLPPKG